MQYIVEVCRSVFKFLDLKKRISQKKERKAADKLSERSQERAFTHICAPREG